MYCIQGVPEDTHHSGFLGRHLYCLEKIFIDNPKKNAYIKHLCNKTQINSPSNCLHSTEGFGLN